MDLGRVGIWSGHLRTLGIDDAAALAAELEDLGFRALWFPAVGSGIFTRARAMLAATDRVVIATGITDIWTSPAPLVADSHRALAAAFPGRFLLGLGVSHALGNEREIPAPMPRPVRAMATFLAELDCALTPVPRDERVLAALGPRMLQLAAERSAGAHPYLIPVSHTRRAREVLGAGPLLAPEVAVLFATDPVRARQIARRHVGRYLDAPNYTNNLLREGFGGEDVRDGGSDRLIDALVGWGDRAAVLRRITAHLDAGADHVCVQVLASDEAEPPIAEWRALANLVGLERRGRPPGARTAQAIDG